MIKSINEIKAIYRKANPTPKVKWDKFQARIKSCLERKKCVDEIRINDALYLNVAEYKTKYRSRRSYVDIQSKSVDLRVFFDTIPSPSIEYKPFRQRVERLKKDHILDDKTYNYQALLQKLL